MAKTSHIVVVDDDGRVRQSLQSVAESAGHSCLTFGSAREFLASGEIDAAVCVILDVRMPGIDGLDEPGVTEMSADLIGNSPKLRAVMEAIGTVAPVDTTVLLIGETGTGKELIARAIHDQSARRRAQFIAVNCAAIPSSLLENELFGHERGAFTGAVGQSIGRFQAAHGGTLFLDEVGDLPLEMQPKLLRALQERQVERLGSGGRALAVDVRVVAATNQDLWGMVQRGSFRADLYYRLNVFPITVPPLRERLDDIPPLVAHFVREFVERHGKSVEAVPAEALEALQQEIWPGNIRELRNVIERAVITARDGILRFSFAERPRGGQAPPTWNLADVTREHILAALAETNWVVGGSAGAAARLGLCRTTLLAKMQRLGIARQASTPALGKTSRAQVGPPCRTTRDRELPSSPHQ